MLRPCSAYIVHKVYVVQCLHRYTVVTSRDLKFWQADSCSWSSLQNWRRRLLKHLPVYPTLSSDGFPFITSLPTPEWNWSTYACVHLLRARVMWSVKFTFSHRKLVLASSLPSPLSPPHLSLSRARAVQRKYSYISIYPSIHPAFTHYPPGGTHPAVPYIHGSTYPITQPSIHVFK